MTTNIDEISNKLKLLIIMCHMHKFNVVYLIAINKIFLINYTNTYRCKLVEELFWKL